MHWLLQVSEDYERQVLKVLNREDFRLPGTRVTEEQAEFERYHQGLLTGADLARFLKTIAELSKPVATERGRLNEVVTWRDGAPLPAGARIRKCKYKSCPKFFKIGNRPSQLFHSRRCATNHFALIRGNEKRRAARRRKLDRVAKALPKFRGMLDWKERTARAARVTKKFISDAVRLGDLKIK